MLHLFFKWRYERKSRAGAFKLPKLSQDNNLDNANLGSYLSQSSVRGRSFKPFDQPRKRRKWVQIITTMVAVAVIVWVAYESIVALALMGN